MSCLAMNIRAHKYIREYMQRKEKKILDQSQNQSNLRAQFL